MIRLVAAICAAVLLYGCADDPMEACMKRGLSGLSAEGSSRGEYIKARERVRAECERKLR